MSLAPGDDARKRRRFLRLVRFALIFQRLGLYRHYWQHRMKSLFPDLFEDGYRRESTAEIVLILGSARSGTTWIGQTLNRSKDPLCYFEEPLYRVSPPLVLGDCTDHTAIDYSTEERWQERMLGTCIHALANEVEAKEKLLADAPFKIQREDDGARKVLIKEVHSLLASEYLLKSERSKILFVLRDPVVLVDSLLDHGGPYCDLYSREFSTLFDGILLSRFFPEKSRAVLEVIKGIRAMSDPYERNMLRLLTTISIMQGMFTILARDHENASILEYERIRDKAEIEFPRISKFLDLSYEEGSSDFSTYSPNEVRQDLISKSRAQNKTKRPWKVLKEEERESCRRLLQSSPLRDIQHRPAGMD